MNTDWMFVSGGMQIGLGIRIKAKNGTLGVTSSKELVLYDDKGEMIDRAPIAQIAFKFSTLVGDSIKMNGHKWPLSFVPPMKTGPFSGGFVAGMEYALRDDVRDGKQKREEFKALIEKIQAESSAGI